MSNLEALRQPLDESVTLPGRLLGVTGALLGAAIAVAFMIVPGLCLADDATKIPVPEPWFIYGVIIVVFVGAIVAILLIRAAVYTTTWSLADALSEEVEITAMTTDAAGQQLPTLDAAGKPVMVTVLRASSSRLIALMGMVAIMLMFLGFGAFILYQFGAGGKMPTDVDLVIKFLVAGMTLFAPYVVNKFSSLFEGLTPKVK
jgi:hypothetical protein